MSEKSDRTRVMLLVGDNAESSAFVRNMLFDAEGSRSRDRGRSHRGTPFDRSRHLDRLERRLVEEVKTVYVAAGQTPIVAVAEATDERLARGCIDAGAQDCLLKHDIRPQIIRRAIDNGIARMRGSRHPHGSDRSNPPE